MLASIVLAVVGAVAFAFGTVLQQGTARSTALRHGQSRRSWLPVLNILGRLLRDRRWLIGWAINEVGFVCHVVALHVGAIAVVQAVLVLQLLFALLIAARRRSLRPTRRDWIGAASVCSGIAALILLRGDVHQVVPSEAAVMGYAGIATAAMCLLLVAARALRRFVQTRTALVAVGAGISFSMTAAFLVMVTDGIAHGGLWGAVGWPLAGVIATSIGGTLLVQDAFASGSLPTAVTAMTITDPVCSAVVGAVLFDAVRPSGLELLLGLPFAASLVVAGVVLLATSPTIHDERTLRQPAAEPAAPQPEAGAAIPEWSVSTSQTVRSHG